MSNTTSGQVYNTVISRERQGEYLGKTVQVIPHITDEIKQRIINCATKQNTPIDVCLVEVGGTVGDIESLPFLEAIRQFRNEHPGRCLNVHLTYVPYLQAAGEIKTKPAQHSVQMLRQIGIFPEVMICRTEKSLDDSVKEKISLFCDVAKEAVIEEVDVSASIYEVPLDLHAQRVDSMICQRLGLPDNPINLDEWHALIDKILHPKGKVVIGIVGKYLEHKDAYKSIFEALHHAATDLYHKLEIRCFEAGTLLAANTGKDDPIASAIAGCDGYLVPGGFGERGWEEKILAARYCRENNIPYFGICLGMQAMCAEFARHKAGIEEATSTEINPYTKSPVISLLSEQRAVQELGGTMRLGAYPCRLDKNSLAYKAYQQEVISERHRHRYEVNNKYRDALEGAGLFFSGILEDGSLCEIAEVKDHPWMVGVQSHPEFKSKPIAPHPLFKAFIEAAIKQSKGKLTC
jgi:CTP synthase